jgi:hypothetical protein
MAETEETKAAIEYWDRVAASGKRGTDQETVERNPDRAPEREERVSAARHSRRR